MGIKFEKVKPGMTLYKTERQREGNTTRRRTVVREYHVLEVGPDYIRVRTGSLVVRKSCREVERLRATNPKCDECERIGGHMFTCSRSRRGKTRES